MKGFVISVDTVGWIYLNKHVVISDSNRLYVCVDGCVNVCVFMMILTWTGSDATTVNSQIKQTIRSWP